MTTFQLVTYSICVWAAGFSLGILVAILLERNGSLDQRR